MMVFASLCTSSPDKFARIMRWRLFPLRDVHPECVPEGYDHPLVRRLCQASRRYERAFHRYFLRHDGGVAWDEDRCLPEHWLFLLEPGLVQWLVLRIGVMVYARAIAHEIEGVRVRAIKSLLGEENYRFALKKAVFLLGTSELSRPLPHDLSSLPRACLDQGFAVFKKLVGPLPGGAWARLRWKFSPIWARGWAGLEEPACARETLEALVRRIVRVERGGEKEPWW